MPEDDILRREIDKEMMEAIKVVPLIYQFMEDDKKWKDDEFRPLKKKVEKWEKRAIWAGGLMAGVGTFGHDAKEAIIKFISGK